MPITSSDNSVVSAGTRYAMGTFLTVQTRGCDPEQCLVARDGIFREIQRLESLWTIYRKDSEVSRVNASAGRVPVHVSQDTYRAVAVAIEFARRSEGAFDPTVSRGRPGNFSNVHLDGVSGIAFSRSDIGLDLGGIGKGLALDQAVAVAERTPGVSRFSADFGGQLFFWDRSGTFEAVDIGIEDPADPTCIRKRLRLQTNGSISTSSNVEQPGHLLDPKTGRAIDHTGSVTVVADSGAEAEAWSTALFAADDAFRRNFSILFPGVAAVYVGFLERNLS